MSIILHNRVTVVTYHATQNQDSAAELFIEVDLCSQFFYGGFLLSIIQRGRIPIFMSIAHRNTKENEILGAGRKWVKFS